MDPGRADQFGGTPANAAYRDVAFSPDGRTLWAYPSSGTGPDTWEFADAVDVESGALETMPRWDTGVVEHPGGGLVLTWRSDQAATLGVFARVDADAVPARLHALRRALLLGVDGYQAPVFSPDGRLFAVRGNAYEQTLDVFEFPSLRSVLCTTLNSPNPKKNVFPSQQEWLEELRSWSDHNVAFAPRSGALLVGTPAGAILRIDLDEKRVTAHPVLDTGVSALTVLTTGAIAVAGKAGDVVLLDEVEEGMPRHALDARNLVDRFLTATSDLADQHTESFDDFDLTDGAAEWGSGDLTTVTEDAATDPIRLQITAHINAYRHARENGSG